MFGRSQKEKDDALRIALYHENAEAVKTALARGANPNEKLRNVGIPLFHALDRNHEGASLATAKILLDGGADIKMTAANGRTPLQYLIGRRDFPLVVKALLEHGADAAAPCDGLTPLAAAVRSKLWKTAGALLDHKSDLERGDVKGETLLVAAIRQGAPLELIERLMEKPMDVNAVPPSAAPALQLAVLRSRQDVVDYLLGLPGTDVNIADGEKCTALLLAVQTDAGIAEALLKAGADPNLATASGQTPLLAAVLQKNDDLVKILLAAGALPGLAGTDDLLPVTAAARQGSGALVAALLRTASKAQAKLELAPALFAALERKDNGIVEQLVAAGADVNAVDKDGRTPLMKAALAGQAALLPLLVKAGAKPEAEDPGGMRAYDHAIGAGQTQAKEFLARFQPGASAPAAVGNDNAPDVLQQGRYIRLNGHCLEVREAPNLSVVFNFWMQQVVLRDPSQAGPLTVQNFDQVQRQESIADAWNKLKEMGGDPPRPAVVELQKKAPGLGRG